MFMAPPCNRDRLASNDDFGEKAKPPPKTINIKHTQSARVAQRFLQHSCGNGTSKLLEQPSNGQPGRPNVDGYKNPCIRGKQPLAINDPIDPGNSLSQSIQTTPRAANGEGKGVSI